jgi:integrase/recombinase XerD
MVDPSRVRVSGPLMSYAGGFAAELSRQGYMPRSACGQLQLMAHASRWLAGEDLDATGFTTAAVERFLTARRTAGYVDHRTQKGLAPLLDYLRGLGVAPVPVAEVAVEPVEELLDRYQRYLTVERGLVEATIVRYVEVVRPFLAGRASLGELDLEHLTASDVSAFVVGTHRDGRGPSTNGVVKALRSLLRFLHVEGLIRDSLTDAVPTAAGWRLAGLPRALEAGQVRRLLASCDRRITAGQRDFAILKLLARLGLRAGEVAALELDDIDWRAGEIVVRGKGDRRERLPLPTDVGQAVATYLRRGRPSGAEGRRVFVRVLAPHRALSSDAVSMAVVAAGRRAGLGAITAHRLRHTAATEMLRAGAPLSEIGQVLRHRSLVTTAIYAKVDREALRALARPWVGGGA